MLVRTQDMGTEVESSTYTRSDRTRYRERLEASLEELKAFLATEDFAWAGRIDDTFTLPAALGTFFVKAVVLFSSGVGYFEHFGTPNEVKSRVAVDA